MKQVGLHYLKIFRNVASVLNYKLSFPVKQTMASRPHKFLLLLLRISGAFLLTAALKDQKFAMEPQDQTAVVGSRVTLPCRVIDKSGILQWTKDDFGLGTHRNLSGFDRYTMIGSDEEGELSLFCREKFMTGNRGTMGIHQILLRSSLVVRRNEYFNT